MVYLCVNFVFLFSCSLVSVVAVVVVVDVIAVSITATFAGCCFFMLSQYYRYYYSSILLRISRFETDFDTIFAALHIISFFLLLLFFWHWQTIIIFFIFFFSFFCCFVLFCSVSLSFFIHMNYLDLSRHVLKKLQMRLFLYLFFAFTHMLYIY